MKKLFKKSLVVILTVVLTLTAAPLGGFVGIDLPSLFGFKAEAEYCNKVVKVGCYEYTVNDTEAVVAKLTDCDSSISGDVVIPSTIDGYLITTIGSYAFTDCNNITSITIPNSVTSIDTGAFSSCDNLKKVVIPDSVTEIGSSVFEFCKNLTDVTLSKSVTKISDYMFADCDSLTNEMIHNIIIHSNITSIGSYAFYLCDNLTNVIIPDCVTEIGTAAFSFCNIEYLHIPESVINITGDIMSWNPGNIICSDTEDCYAKTYADIEGYKFKLCTGHNVNTFNIYGREFKNNLEWFMKNWDSSKYSPELANMLAALSAAVYKESDIKQAYKELGFDDCELYDYESGTSPFECGYALAFKQTESGETICLVTVRGTQLLDYNKDWIGNFVTRNVPGVDGGKHPGFSQPANRIYDNIQNYIDSNNITGDVKYYVTGHSRGAAVGNLLSVKLMENDVASSDVYNYNYATPDVAAKVSFPKYDNIFNVCNREDAVPHVPGIAEDVIIPDIPGTSWGKYGQTHWFTKDAPNTGNFAEDKIADHSMDLYLEFLDEQTPPSEWKKTFGDSVHDAGYTASGWLGKFRCPVDVIITDKNGNKIASVIDGETNYYDSKLGNVIILTDGDKKVIYINGDNDFNVNLVGTDSGEMTYTIEQYNIQNEKALESKTFENVKLEKGKQMFSPVSNADKADDVELFVTETQNGQQVVTHTVSTSGTETAVENETPDNPDEPSDPTIDWEEITPIIKKPSKTTINYGDTLVLQLEEIEIPEGYAVAWFVEGAGVSTSVSEDGLECRVTSVANGNPTIYAKLVDEEENVITNADGEEIFDEITLVSIAGFWQKFISFFKNLFGINRVIY